LDRIKASNNTLHLPINIELQGNRILINYMGKEIKAYIYVCDGTKKDIDKEIKELDISPSHPIAIIPFTMINSIWQIVFGIINYEIIHTYRKNLYDKFRNKGLLLSMLITGEQQLGDIINRLRDEYVRSNSKYFVISLQDCIILSDKCSEDVQINASIEPRHLIKNVDNYLKLI